MLTNCPSAFAFTTVSGTQVRVKAQGQPNPQRAQYAEEGSRGAERAKNVVQSLDADPPNSLWPYGGIAPDALIHTRYIRIIAKLVLLKLTSARRPLSPGSLVP